MYDIIIFVQACIIYNIGSITKSKTYKKGDNMKKKKSYLKPFFSVSLTFSLMFSLFSPIQAATLAAKQPTNIISNLTEKQLDGILIEKKFPESLLQTMRLGLKERFAQAPGTFEGYSTKSFYLPNSNQNTVKSNVVSVSPLGNIITPLGNIPSNQLQLQIFTVRKSSTVVDAYFEYGWFLAYLPFNRLYDPFGMTWDQNVFQTVVASHHTDYYEDSAVTDAVQFSEVNRSADVGAGHIDWNANMRSQFHVPTPLGLYGEGFVELKSNSPNVKSQFYGKYSHTTTVGSYGFSYLGFGSFSWSGSSGHDDAAIFFTPTN